MLYMLWERIFKIHKRMYIVDNDFEEKFFVSMLGMSTHWLVIQFYLIGLVEVFKGMGSIELFYEEAHDSIRSLVTSFTTIAGGLSHFLSTFINSVIKLVTSKNGHTS
eukprot:Gb_32482 [translate_table: standard]